MFYEVLFNIFAFILRCGETPQHLAIIPDNNRTFCKKKCLSLMITYLKGQQKLFEIIKYSIILKISNVTVYLLSTHNLYRKEYEKQCVYDAVYVFLHTLLIKPMKCRVRIIGDISPLPEVLQELSTLLVDQTKNNNGTLVNLAINYSGKNELADISFNILNRNEDLEIHEKTIHDMIYTKDSADVDVLIRTSPHRRLSEFLLWQNTRSVLQFINVCWPEITKWHLLISVFLYQYYKKKN